MSNLQTIFGQINIEAFWQEVYRMPQYHKTARWKASDILPLRYAYDGEVVRTYREMAKVLDLSYQRVKYLHDQFILRLRHPSRKRNFICQDQ